MTSPFVGPTCRNCGTRLVGKFCHACGQSAADHSATVRAFVGHAVRSALNYDSRILRTLVTLVTRPGELTAAWIDGARARYMPPLQVYLFGAAVFFLTNAYSPIVTFDPAKWRYASRAGTIAVGGSIPLDRRTELARAGVSAELFGERFQNFVGTNLSTFLILSVPVFALLVAAMRFRVRRPGPLHAVFALHWSAFYFLFAAITQLVTQLPIGSAVLGPVAVLLLAVLGVYLVIAIRRVYAARWGVAAAQGVVLVFAYLMVLAAWLEGVLRLAAARVS